MEHPARNQDIGKRQSLPKETPPDIRSQRTTLGDGVYRYLLDSIISLRLQPGQMVFESEIADALGVSRTPVREAFRLLISQELLDVMPQRGARIAFISRKKMRETQFVRVSLEVSAFRLVARLWDSSSEEYREAEYQLGLQLEKQARSAGGDPSAFLGADEEFHRLILEKAKNATLLSVISVMRAHLKRVRYLELKEGQHYGLVMEQHRGILQAVISNREARAALLVRRHIQYMQHDFPRVLSKYSHFFSD